MTFVERKRGTVLELYQFELSQFSEKVRLILDYKGLEYRKIEVTPGIGQLDVYRLSGQRKVPVLKDGERVIADSTAIARYLEEQYPQNPILPDDPKQKGLCLMMEEWADQSLGINSRKILLKAVGQSQEYRNAWLPEETPDPVRDLVSAFPSDLVNLFGMGVGVGPDVLKEAEGEIDQDLESLCLLLGEGNSYLVSDRPTLADLTVAALSILLKFPEGSYLDLPPSLKGKGIPGIADNPDYANFFMWRDRIYRQFRQPLDGSPSSGSSSDSSPTRIEIE